MAHPLDPVLLAGLHELSVTAFPKRCAVCGRVYASVDDYIARTARINGTRTGLKASCDDDGAPIVELYRNCECGSTLMDVFQDRRDLSGPGQKRRARFGELLDYLVERGVERNVGREELLKAMRGQPSPLLRGIRPPGKG